MAKESFKEDGRPSQQWYWDDWFSEFGLRLCSLAARGLWIDMLGIMFKAEIRGTLIVNGRQINSKAIAKIANDSKQNIDKYLRELEDNDVFSRLQDGTIYSRRMYRESKKKEEIRKIRMEAGKKGARERWQKDSKDITKGMAKIAASTSTSSSSSPSNNENTKVFSAPNDKNHSEPKATKPLKIEFNFNERTWLNIKEEDLLFWFATYPACNIKSELNKMADWLLSNPSKRKKNYRRFISNWLTRTQDKGGSRDTSTDELDAWAEKQAKKEKEI